MNTSVALFFVSNIVATVILGLKFTTRKDRVFRTFGAALLLDAVAFAVWTIGYIYPSAFLTCITIGAVVFLISLVVFFYTSLLSESAGSRLWFTILGIVVVIAIFTVGHYSPAYAFISPEGFMFFNLTPFVQLLYVFALLLAAVPTMNLIASKFQRPYSALVRYGFIFEVAGGIMLITSINTVALNTAGWIIAIVYLILWITLLFNRQAWSGTN
ncbi:MAG: hypothetical protein WCT02_03975 [Candidatus Paceibacterota bacterium]